ncbi:MAG: hypothetical protein V3T72_11835 [Thermoanaerobaculia bacterium]
MPSSYHQLVQLVISPLSSNRAWRLALPLVLAAAATALLTARRVPPELALTPQGPPPPRAATG